MSSSFTFSVGFNIEVADIVTLLFDGCGGPITVYDMPPTNAGMHICNITAVTASGNPYTTPIQLAGDESEKFALTNGGVCPCELVVGATDLTVGIHAGTWMITTTI